MKMNIVALVVMVAVLILFVAPFLTGAKPEPKRFDGVYINPDFRRKTQRQCRSEYTANRQLAGK